MKKFLLVFLLFALLAGAAAGIYLWLRQETRKPPPPPPTATVALGSIRAIVQSTGRIVANLDVEIKCKAGGEIVKLPFDISDRVKKGDLLLQLDPVDEQRGVDLNQISLSSYKARLKVAQVNLALAEEKLATDRRRVAASTLSVQARLERARTKAERLQVALEHDAASQEEYDVAKTDAIQSSADLTIIQVQADELKQQEAALELRRQDVTLAEANVRADEIQLANAQQRLKDTKVLAPMDGIVAASNVQVGQIISSGISNVGGGTAILTLTDLSRLFVLGSIDESDIGRIAVGQRVKITADAFPGKFFRGEVVRIATRGVNSSNVVTFEVKIEVKDAQKSLLKPEMTANLEIVVAHKENVPLIPVEALSRRQGKSWVTIQNKAGVPEEREIEVGVNNGTQAEVVSGLVEGAVIILQTTAGDGKWLKADDKQNPLAPSFRRRR
jgi:HlyD family secretion protein